MREINPDILFYFLNNVHMGIQTEKSYLYELFSADD